MPRLKKNYSRPHDKKFKSNNNNFRSKQHSASATKKRRNYKFIKRSKEAEDAQRQQKIVEDKYKKRNDFVEESMSEDEELEENAFDQLLSCFQDSNQDKKKKYDAIESSSDEETDKETEDEIEDDILENAELTWTEEAEEEEESIGEEEEGSNDENSNDENIESDHGGESDSHDPDDMEFDDEIELRENSSTLKISDPFSIHFEHNLSDEFTEVLSSKLPINKTYRYTWKELGNLQIEIPTCNNGNNIDSKQSQSTKKNLLLSDELNFAMEGKPPELISHKRFNTNDLHIKSQIESNILEAKKLNFKIQDPAFPLTELQCEIFSILNNYQDLYFPQRSFDNAEEIRFIYCLHVINHMLKTRTKILHHNAKLLLASNKKDNAIIPDSCKDQGLVRPKVLIVVPFRDSAFRVVNNLISILLKNKGDIAATTNVINYKRFVEEYTGDTLRFPKRNPKPEDYEQTFAGNTDDSFRIGISLTKKSIKLYTDFYSSDILISSPLGLRMIVGAPGDAERDYDFLTSIEILILDQAELFLAQNWDHLLHVLDHLHLQPQSVRNTDFSRVRTWCLNGLSKFYRQTLLFTSHELPEFRSLFSSRFANYRGKIRIANPIINGSIRQVIVQIPQVFHKIDVTSIDSSFDTRFQYFMNEILPQYKSPSMAHCMIYVPSYFDYVRLRNQFKSDSLNFVQICEYTKDGKIARARDMFFHSGAHFLLYSERAHFFRRTRIKGIRHLIMYQPPCWPNLYSEMINLMQDSNQNPRDGLETSMTITILYTKYDIVQISGIIGSDKASKICQSNKKTHMFTTAK